MTYLPLLLIGILITIVGIPNLRGNISTVHRYNRRRVSEEDIPRYGRLMGVGTIIIGLSIVLTAALLMAFNLEVFFYLIVAGAGAGAAVMVYAQFKYNKGIF